MLGWAVMQQEITQTMLPSALQAQSHLKTEYPTVLQPAFTTSYWHLCITTAVFCYSTQHTAGWSFMYRDSSLLLDEFLGPWLTVMFIWISSMRQHSASGRECSKMLAEGIPGSPQWLDPPLPSVWAQFLVEELKFHQLVWHAKKKLAE